MLKMRVCIIFVLKCQFCDLRMSILQFEDVSVRPRVQWFGTKHTVRYGLAMPKLARDTYVSNFLLEFRVGRRWGGRG